jgi:molybdopterin converting factor small subunit
MRITIKGFWIFKRFLCCDQGTQISLNAATLKDALTLLAKELGEEFDQLIFEDQSKRVKRSIGILLNGQNYLNLTKRLHTPLKDGDEICLLPMVAGG